MSIKTIRHVQPVSTFDADGLVARVYDQVQAEFFINGTITSHSAVPELMAGMWAAGREAVMVSHALPRRLKEAMGAEMSYHNRCPYCADMLVSLVHGAGEHAAAKAIRRGELDRIDDDLMRRRLDWAGALARGEWDAIAADTPFSPAELPEALGSVLVFGYTNRLTHALFDDSPVGAPLGQGVKSAMLRLFGRELRSTTAIEIEPGRGLDLLPPASHRAGPAWAAATPRVADALARWQAALERAVTRHVPDAVQRVVQTRCDAWDGERMPLSRGWAREAVAGLDDEHAALAQLGLVTALASYQVDAGLVDGAWRALDGDEARLVTLLAWASWHGARRCADIAAANAEQLR